MLDCEQVAVEVAMTVIELDYLMGFALDSLMAALMDVLMVGKKGV